MLHVDNTTTTANLLANVTVRSEQEITDDVIVASAWSTFVLYSFIANSAVILSILTSSDLRSMTSYWFIVSFSFCDIGMLVVSITHIIPNVLFHDKFSDFVSLRSILMLFFYDIFWYTEVVHLNMMAINRFISIVFPTSYSYWYSNTNTTYLLLLSYSLGIAVSVPTLFPCCYTLWDSYNYISVYFVEDTWYKYVDLSINSISLAVMVVAYTGVLYKLRELRHTMEQFTTVTTSSMQARKTEVRLFFQFFVGFLIYLLTWTTWQWLPYTSASKWTYFAMTSLFFLNNAAGPTINFLFNKHIRKNMLRIVFRRKSITVILMMSKTSKMTR